MEIFLDIAAIWLGLYFTYVVYREKKKEKKGPMVPGTAMLKTKKNSLKTIGKQEKEEKEAFQVASKSEF